MGLVKELLLQFIYVCSERSERTESCQYNRDPGNNVGLVVTMLVRNFYITYIIRKQTSWCCQYQFDPPPLAYVAS